MKDVFECQVETYTKFASGNQMSQGRGRLYRNPEYTAYKKELKQQFIDILDEVGYPEDLFGKPLKITMIQRWPVPKTLIKTKKQQETFQRGLVLPVTRGVIDWDNACKAIDDVLQDVFNFDDSQIVDAKISQRYWAKGTYGLDIKIEASDIELNWEWC